MRAADTGGLTDNWVGRVKYRRTVLHDALWKIAGKSDDMLSTKNARRAEADMKNGLLISMILLLSSSPLTGQNAQRESQEITEILIAAMAYIKTDLPDGPIGLDPTEATLLTSDEEGNVTRHGCDTESLRDSGISRAVATNAGVRIARRQGILLCGDQTEECRSNGVLSHVRISNPRIEGDVATVSYGVVSVVVHQGRLNPREADRWSLSAILTLEQVDGRWVVTDEQVLVVS